MTATPPTDTGPAPTPTTEPPSPPADRGAWNRWRPLLLRWHFYAGILIGPFILVAAVTGLLYAVIPQVDAAVYRHELTVDHVGTQRIPLGEQIAAARSSHPEGTITAITPATAADDTTRVMLAVDDVPVDHGRTVFVDPYTGEVRGALTTYGQWLPVRAWFDELHRTLHLGEIGRNYSELAASWLWVVALGGLVLWIGYRRRTRKLRRLLVPDRAAPTRQRTLSWHGAVGVWIVVGLIVLAASGLSWSRHAGANIADLRSAMAWTTPSVSTSAVEPDTADTGHDGHDHGGAGGPSSEGDALEGVDAVVRTAQEAGLQGPMNLTPPSEPGAAWVVKENKRDAPTRFDAVAIDSDTHQIVDRVDFAQWPFMAKMTSWAINAHMGVLFGLVNQIVLALLAVGLITVIVRGYLMWWRRRPTRLSHRTLPVAPRRGALTTLKPGEAVAVVVVVAAVGWFVPLFGIPLVVFVVVDALRGLIGSHRNATEVTQ
ncbi:PepSY-associated TM helix domain-containing protein [Gordonia rhizosphera]|uniref:PepSY domain-containing protein n=1 Tax=Gordonia rhizosphera NBRC 16068 TaxID=1108045 RepID=K6WBA6_9ACTN|nr:hypothetical protein GORHZ_062_00580 [Gordonia rhizosphera NBRC 16068]